MKKISIYGLAALTLGAALAQSCSDNWEEPAMSVPSFPEGSEATITIADLKAKIESLVTELSAVKAELAEYKSVHGKLRTADLEQENDRLRSSLRTYEEVISRNNLWDFFRSNRNKNRNRDDAR